MNFTEFPRFHAIVNTFERSALHGVTAQIDLSFSNSLIEAWWRSLKHRWLYLHQLDNIATMKRLVTLYVTEHNQRIPHAAFDGQSPDEIYFDRRADVPDELAVARREARKRRAELNRAVACTTCPRGAPTPNEHFAARSIQRREAANAIASRKLPNVRRRSRGKAVRSVQGLLLLFADGEIA